MTRSEANEAKLEREFSRSRKSQRNAEGARKGIAALSLKNHSQSPNTSIDKSTENQVRLVHLNSRVDFEHDFVDVIHGSSV